MLRSMVLCPLGDARVEAMSFMTDRRAIAHQLDLLREMIMILTESARPMPTDGFFDLTESLKRIRLVGTFLETEELFHLSRALSTIAALVRYFNPKEGEEVRSATQEIRSFPLLKALTEDVLTFPDIVRRIDQTLTPNGEIRDNASPALAEIRHQMAANLSSISRLLNSILRSAQSEGIVDKDVSPTMRDGRLVIPIPPGNKRKIRGIVHDESATGKTLYVEPAEVVDANNRIRELESEERQEIIRILTSITNEIRPLLPDMMAGFDFLAEVDFLHAKAKFAQRIDALVPELASDGVTDWVQARHPLLYLRYKAEGKAQDIVPLDILLDRQRQRIVLISGPNAGGKSVCLETLGLLQYMLQCGLAIPVKENSRCAVFDHIFIDIGDEQSIDNDLSTYSSHLQNMKFFVRNATKRTLILIDEFGSGTEPQIGGAIAQALLGKFNEAKVNGVITTHFTNLKLYADETQGIVNGAMLYDRGNMRPLFMLEVGRPGSSFAIEIAHKIGLPAEVIDEAKRIVGSDYVNVDKYLQDISRDKRYWEQKRQRIHQQEKELEELATQLEERAKDLKAKRQELIKGAKDEAASLLREANARIEKTIREIKEAQAEKEATRTLRQGLKDFSQKLGDEAKPHRKERQIEQMARLDGLTSEQKKTMDKVRRQQSAEGKADANAPLTADTLRPGDNVRLKGQLTAGEVLSVNGRQCTVAFGLLKSTVDISRLERVSKGQIKREQSITVGVHDPAVSDAIRERRLNFKQEIDVRGMRADEALQAVMYFLDDAILLSMGQVRILHGTGTGALRQAIRQYLSTLPGVSDYHDEHVQFGGAGITVVDID